MLGIGRIGGLVFIFGCFDCVGSGIVLSGVFLTVGWVEGVFEFRRRDWFCDAFLVSFMPDLLHIILLADTFLIDLLLELLLPDLLLLNLLPRIVLLVDIRDLLLALFFRGFLLGGIRPPLSF